MSIACNCKIGALATAVERHMSRGRRGQSRQLDRPFTKTGFADDI